jgi:cysteine desulfurase / selenocysteine lyase
MKKLNVMEVRKDFPILERTLKNGKKLIYLDSAATSQKPLPVILAMDDYYRKYNANIHRGVHELAEEATGAYEAARNRVTAFIGARSHREVIYTRNATESINLVAYSWGRANLKQGDVVILTEMEHHSNIVPWHMLASERGITLEFIPVLPDGVLDLNVYNDLLKKQPKLVSFTHMSNVVGTINPVKEMTRLAHEAGAIVLVDGAQSIPHLPVNVQDLGVDFMAFSGHKMGGPTGIGILYGKEKLLGEMPPFMGGGDMIKRVYLRSFIPNDLPHKFEAGTPAIAEAIGLGAAVDYLNGIGMEEIANHEKELISYALDRLSEVPGITVIGPEANKKGGIAAFEMKGVHPHDIAQILDGEGIAVRAGHHCAMPLHDKFNLPATTRASFWLYNMPEEVDALIKGLDKVQKLFG